MKEAERALQLANELHRLAVVVRDARDAITLQDLDGRTLAWNAGAERLYGWSEAEALAMNVHDRIPPDERGNAMELLRKLSNDEVLAPYRARRLTSSGDIVAITITSTALVDANAHVYAISTTERPFESGT